KYAAMALNAGENKPVSDKWAIVVGISNFADSSINLKYAAKDATDFASFLVGQENFKRDHIKLLTDKQATKDNIISQLGDGWLGKFAHKDDLVVVYVSSHGSSSDQDVGVNFLVAHDTDKYKLVSTGIPMQWLSKIIQEQVRSDRVVLILDVCHSGSATASPSSKASSESSTAEKNSSDDAGGKGLFVTAATTATTMDPSKLSLGSGQIVLCSSLADQVSWESKNYQNSVFTHQLIEALQCDGKQTTLHQAYDHLKKSVESEVLRDRGAMQTPNLSNKLWQGGDPSLAVVPEKGTTMLAAPTQAPSQASAGGKTIPRRTSATATSPSKTSRR
ncbi:MAG TPA: caspase family protein, partial [Chroococcales cyanobacterium]